MQHDMKLDQNDFILNIYQFIRGLCGRQTRLLVKGPQRFFNVLYDPNDEVELLNDKKNPCRLTSLSNGLIFSIRKRSFS